MSPLTHRDIAQVKGDIVCGGALQVGERVVYRSLYWNHLVGWTSAAWRGDVGQQVKRGSSISNCVVLLSNRYNMVVVCRVLRFYSGVARRRVFD